MGFVEIKSAGKNNGTARACGLGHNMHILLLGSTKTERVADLSLLFAIDWRQLVPRWYKVWLLQLPPLHTQREGKLMKVLTRIMPSNVGSERQAVFATVCS